MKTILLNPGPVTLSARVRQAMLNDDLCHREVEFATLQSGIRKKILDVYALKSRTWAIALLTGSGTAAVEAMITSLVPASVGCAVAANKCLHGVPGACFVVVNRKALAIGSARNLYLDLSAYVTAKDSGNTPFTQSVQAFYALNEALDELVDAGGIEKRRELYLGRMDQVRCLLRDLNIVPLLNDEDCSCVLHAYRIPEFTNYQQLHDHLKNAGFIIYAGQGSYATSMFRISIPWRW